MTVDQQEPPTAEESRVEEVVEEPAVEAGSTGEEGAESAEQPAEQQQATPAANTAGAEPSAESAEEAAPAQQLPDAPAADAQPAAEEAQPPTEEAQPPMEEAQPPTEEAQPLTEEAQPPAEEAQPAKSADDVDCKQPPANEAPAEENAVVDEPTAVASEVQDAVEAQVKPEAEEAAVEPASATEQKDGESADDKKEEAREADDGDKDGDGSDANPLVMDERKGGTAKNKKKKSAGATAAKEKPTSNLDLINARLKELQDKTERSTAAAKQSQPAVNPMEQATEVYKKGGEKAVRDALQKSIQDTKKLERDAMLLKRKNDNLTKEKEKVTLDAAELKATQQRSRLRCLDIQKQIKTLKDVADKLEVEKETQRSELETRLQTAIDEVTTKIKDGQDERDKLVKENEELAEKIKEIEKECETRFDKYRDLNDEKSDVLTEKRKEESEQEKVAHCERQRAQLTEDALRMTVRSCDELRAQIKLYTEKMSEFESSVEQSKSVFGTFGNELQKMKDHEQACANSRDAAKQDLAAIAKRAVDTAELRTTLRKQITQQQAATTKSKEMANRLQSRRAEYKPFEAVVKQWLEQAQKTREEEAPPAGSDKEKLPASTNVHHDPFLPTKPSADERDKENQPPLAATE
ncbi:hypothetical protein DIPPA_12605 [Diplonema papillatum]|nr:hypothetical protein DIPPA_12605 [Diplonema papillatum]